VRRRAGSTLQIALAAGASNFWSNGSYAVYRTGPKLYHYTPGETPVQLYTGFAIDSRMAYAEVNQYLYASDGNVAIKVDMTNDSMRRWGVECPAGQPSISQSANGGLDAGAYQIAITYVDQFSEESGTGLAVSLDVAEGGGILLSGIPQPHESNVAGINVYATRPGGLELLYVATLPVGTTSWTLLRGAYGKPLGSQFLSRVPAADIAAFAAGRLFFTVGNMLGWSESLYFGQTDASEDYVLFSDVIDLMVPSMKKASMTGVFVGAGDATYFLAGADPALANSVIAYHAGVVPGSLVYVPGSAFDPKLQLPAQPLPTWISTNGVQCIGRPDGSILPITEGRYAMDSGSQAAAFYRETRGVRQAVYAMQPPTEKSALSFSDTAAVTVVRNGIQI
jgi:hypothetical protein